MGSSGFSSVDYDAAVRNLRQTGQAFKRSTVAAQTGNLRNIAEILDPRKLKGGIREACFAQGFNDALPIVVSIDGTGSMEDVPHVIQKDLPSVIDLLTEKGISDHPNLLFMCHDDERAIAPDALFQMSQFEAGTKELIKSLNEMIIPNCGGGNRGEAYHLAFYAAANHTRLETFEKNGEKGFFIMICDEEPYYEDGDPAKFGTSPEIAKEVFGDKIEADVPMLESVKKVAERFHIFIIRPGHTAHGRNREITKRWQKLLKAAGENPEHVLEVEETDAIISTMVLAIGRLHGVDKDEIADVLRAKGAGGVDAAVNATSAIVPVTGALAVTAKVSGTLATSENAAAGRKRR